MTGDELDDAAIPGKGAERPGSTTAPRAVTFMVPEPGGFGLQRALASPTESRRPEPDHAGETQAAAAPSLEDYAERCQRDSSHRFAPLRHAPSAAGRLEALALIEELVTLWTEIEANWRPLLQDEFTHDVPERIDRALRAGHDVVANGLILALASRACLHNPCPENRQMLADLSPRYPGCDSAVAAILEAPADRLPATLIEHLARFEAHAEQQKRRVEFAIGSALDGHREPGPADPAPAAPRSPDLANDNTAAPLSVRDQDAPPPAGPRAHDDTSARDDRDGANDPLLSSNTDGRAASPPAEFDWQRIATEAALELHRQNAEPQRGPEPESVPTEREQHEATREQTDARRERLAHEFHRAAREVVADVRHAPGRARDEEGGREV